MKKLLFWIFLLVFHFTASAQEPAVFSQFFMNPYIYNPAYAGVDGHTVISAMYRQQWVGLSDGPAISHVTFHTPLKGGMGVGVFAFNERQSILTSSGIKGTFSYLANFDRKHWLRFGLSLGAGTNMIDLQAVDPTDPAFTSFIDNSFHALGDFGIAYHSGNFNFGVAIPNLFSHDIVNNESFAKIRVKPYDNLFLKANYHLGFLNDDYVWEPHVLYRYSHESGDQIEVASVIHVLHHIWFGASYRQVGNSFTDGAIIGLFGIKIKEKLAIGYAFEFGDSKLRSFTGNTHEIHIGFHLGTKKEHAQHASSFIKRHRKTAEERKAEAEARRLAKLEGETEDTEDNALLQTNAETDDYDGDEEQVAVQDQTTDDTPFAEKNPLQPSQNTGVESDNEFQTTFDTDNIIDRTLTNDDRTPEQLAQSDQPLRVRRGGHLLELAQGNYVINGAFRVFEHAENFSDTLFSRGFHDVIVGYVTATGYYYVVVSSIDDLEAALDQVKRLRSRSDFEKSWVLIVE